MSVMMSKFACWISDTCKRKPVPKGDEYPIEKSMSSLSPHIEMKDQNIVWPNTIFTYTCPENYTLIGHKTRMCTETRRYTAEIPKCKGNYYSHIIIFIDVSYVVVEHNIK